MSNALMNRTKHEITCTTFPDNTTPKQIKFFKYRIFEEENFLKNFQKYFGKSTEYFGNFSNP